MARTVLLIDCCVHGEQSRTLKLARRYLDTLEDVQVNHQKLYELDLAPLSYEETVERKRTDIAKTFAQADEIVVAAPYWDLSYPAALRIYMEDISANGLCYHYEADGCHGDCRGQWLVYLTSGGDFEHEDSVGVVHWRQMAAMFGIPRFDYVFAGGMDIDPAKTPELLAAGCDLARRLAESL